MCGIIGYIGKENALPILLEGLKREAYRGYDSAGVVVFGEKARCVKAVGKLEKLEEKLQGQLLPGMIGIGHTRWATHGGVTEENAHPHADCKQNIFVVHNGIIENFLELRRGLEAGGHRFSSETDTEVLPHLIERFFRGNLEEAVCLALNLVRGAYGIAVIAREDPEKLVVAKLSSPLVLATDGEESFIASDPAALISHSQKMTFLDDEEIAVLQKGKFLISDFKRIAKIKEVTELDWTVEEAQKGGFPHFMLKEIMGEAESTAQSLRGRIMLEEGNAKLGGLEAMRERLRTIDKVSLVACGTAHNMSMVGEYMLEEYARIPCDVDLGSEFRYRQTIIDDKTAFIFVSQSGETADTLGAMHEVKSKGGLTLGVVNVVGSALARETDAGVYTHAGPEIGVASTKASISQLAVLALITLFLGRQRDLSLVMGQRIARELSLIPELISKTLQCAPRIDELAQKYGRFQNFWFIGRKYNYPIAIEGALKLKELAYVHAEGIAGGELKHGSLALIDKNFPTIAICPSDSMYMKMVSNIHEIKARGGPVIAIATEGNDEIKWLADDVIYIPKTLEMLTPILSVIPMQFFAYYSGVLRGYDVDKPRNLAKSVTVE